MQLTGCSQAGSARRLADADRQRPWQRVHLERRPGYLRRWSRIGATGVTMTTVYLAVSFQQVVHPVRTGKAELVEASVILGGPDERS
ncbi:hypothetical protein MES5069_220165 [Mesorhizobium escarrei]|uniref:Uncharacterized protein n=1 Tax=Mesorhizobium escarrei TaxID=666018 RepID=A0ABM9DRW9_9HYPH|nr:hypothetical protein MES5069_220165 [Mesorhizobium escarrei]